MNFLKLRIIEVKSSDCFGKRNFLKFTVRLYVNVSSPILDILSQEPRGV